MFREKMFKSGLFIIFLAILTIFLAFVYCQNIIDLECPFPEGQVNVTEDKCLLYNACEWTSGVCHMRSNEQAGYKYVGQQSTSRGYKNFLQKIDPNLTLFGGDINDLTFEVIHHEDYHLQIKIYDSKKQRYEVPLTLSLPEKKGRDQKYFVTIGFDPFHFTVTRIQNSQVIFHTIGPLTFEDQFIQLHIQLPSVYLYGFGENTHTSLLHSFSPRTTFPIFARDQHVNTEQLNEYGAHPYYQVVEDYEDSNTHSVLLYNSNAMEYSTFMSTSDIHDVPMLTLRTIGGIIDLHFFLGPTPEEANQQYAQMVGLPIFPPYWSLGFHLSRWGYGSSDQVRIVRDRMREAGIPQDVQTFDIDYMERHRDFTYDPVNFHDMSQLIQELHAEGLRVTLILDPALVIDWDKYPPSFRGREKDVFVKWMSQELVPEDQVPGCRDYIVGFVWPDNQTVFPDFFRPETHEWWSDEIKRFHEVLNFDAIWIDMNEPANFETNLGSDWSLMCPDNELDLPPYPTKMIRVGSNPSKRISDHSICMSSVQSDGTSKFLHYDVHSLYGITQTIATYNALDAIFPGKRQVVLSRSTFPGSGKYAVHWLGDNAADWTHMKMSIIGMIEFNMFGIPMVGADICGFFDEPSEEMCARWMQLGAFYPFSRNHNILGTADQDPAMWPVVAKISRDVLLLRYKYLPFLYTLFHQASTTGSSVIRSVYNVFPNNYLGRYVDDQFFWGSQLMVAPVLQYNQRNDSVFFPQGIWYDLVTGERYVGSGYFWVETPLEKIPVFVRGGSILPWQEPAVTTAESRKNPFGITVALNGDFQAEGFMYWDDGDSAQLNQNNSLEVDFVFQENTLQRFELRIKPRPNNYQLESGVLFRTVVIYGFPSNPNTILASAYDEDELCFGWMLSNDEWTFKDEVLTVTFLAPENINPFLNGRFVMEFYR